MPDPRLPLARLIALSPAVRPVEIALETDRCELGRSALRTVVIALETVSRLHAAIERRDDRYWLTDAGSTNGTFVNGRPIAATHLLVDGDEIGLGGPEPLLRFLDGDRTVLRDAVPARLRFDHAQLGFTVDGRPFPLPPIQLRLLHHLVTHSGQVCSRESCAEAAWGRSYEPDLDRDALDKAVSKLRQRLAAADPALAAALQNRRGEGYVWQG